MTIDNTTFELDQKQIETIEKIKEWFQEQEANLYGPDPEGIGIDFPTYELTKPIFRIFGYAGTGKTTIIRHFMEALSIRHVTAFAAYTGKAAMVMRKQGLPASTIHSLIYLPVPPNQEECKRISKAIENEEDSEKKKALKVELKEKSKVHFVLRDKTDARLENLRLIVLDECSMVNDEMLNDLLSFSIPIIVLGDPGQLPPIEGEGAITKEKPDVLLTQIHRQALGNPILDFANRARMGLRHFPKIQLGQSKHVDQSSLSSGEVLKFDQIICGKNNTRQKLNQRIRGLKGFSEIYPQVGEKLICLKNNAEDGLFNGMMCEVVEVMELLDLAVQLKIKKETDDEESHPIIVQALRSHFDSYSDKDAVKNQPWWEKKDYDEFDFGYAITCHKSQGSQWDKVLIWDDKFLVWDWKERAKWLYTAITRAVEEVTIAS